MTTLKTFFRLLALLFLALFSLHCKKEEPCEHGNSDYPIPVSMQDNIFQVGTYWVFQDSASGDPDSIFVAQTLPFSIYEICVGGPGPCNKSHYDHLGHAMRLESSLNGNMGYLTLDRHCISLESTVDDETDPISVRRGAPVMFEGEPGRDRGRFVCYEDAEWRTLYEQNIDSLQLGNRTFTDVRKFVLPAHRYAFLNDQEVALTVYWADPIGWIRLEKRTEAGVLTEVANLIRWNIQL